MIQRVSPITCSRSNRPSALFFAVLALFALHPLTTSASDVGESSSAGIATDFQSLNESIGVSVIQPVLERFVAHAKDMEAKALAVDRNPSSIRLNDFFAGFQEVSEYREMLRAFEFGPVHSMGLSASLDTPVDTGAIDLMLSDKQLFNEYVIGERPLLKSMQGFSAIEYLISNWQLESSDDQYKDRQRRYLKKLAENVSSTALAMHQVWFGNEGGYSAFSTVLSSAGDPDNASYMTVESGTEELVRASIDTLSALLEEGMPEYSQSALSNTLSNTSFSQNTSIRRIRGAINGVANSYTGKYFQAMDGNSELSQTALEIARVRGAASLQADAEDSSDNGVSRWVALHDFDVDARIGSSLIAALSSANSLAESSDFDTEQHQVVVKELIGQVELTQQLLEIDVLPMIQSAQVKLKVDSGSGSPQ